jgi:hypothetical protein
MPCRDYDYEDLDNVTPTQLDDRTKKKPDILSRLKLY